MAITMDSEEYYYDVDNSVQILDKLLHFQFNSDEDITHFLREFYLILEKKVPKRNTILVKGPPSSGKNVFFDVFTEYLLNKGTLSRAN